MINIKTPQEIEEMKAAVKTFMKYMSENPGNFDPKKPSVPGMEAITQIVASHMDNLGSSHKA